MNDQIDDSQSHALMALAGLVALVIAGVLGLAISKGAGPKSAAAAHTANAAFATTVAGAPDGRVYFASGSDSLPPEASEILVKVADAARMQSERVVLISVFQDANGDAASHAELAKKRAQAVRHALEANGVAPDHLVLDRPVMLTGSTDARDARRVEMRLR